MTTRSASLPSGAGCPRDGGPLVSRTTAEVRHLYCLTCHGLWFPADELRAVAARIALGAAAPRPPKQVALVGLEEGTARCLCDGSPLMSNHHAHGVTLDLCAACGALWLDGGELQRVVAQLRVAGPTVSKVVDGPAGDPGSTSGVLDALEILEPIGGALELLFDVLGALGDF
jgi:Zn-finger nucleic acid-binding protein